jgi:hypothetical protein
MDANPIKFKAVLDEATASILSYLCRKEKANVEEKVSKDKDFSNSGLISENLKFLGELDLNFSINRINQRAKILGRGVGAYLPLPRNLFLLELKRELAERYPPGISRLETALSL